MTTETKEKSTALVAGSSASELVDAALTTSEVPSRDPEFLHSVLCQVGLPRSQVDGREFMRQSGSAMLMIEAGKWFDGLNMHDMFVPYGTRPRLVLFHLCSEAVRCRSAEVEVENSASAFLQRLGIEKSGRSMAAFKRQMLALAACRMQLGYRTADDRAMNVKCDPIRKFEAWVQEVPGQRSMWPGVVTLSNEFYETLVQHAVPLDPEAIHQLQNSALALDVYTWLAHRLCRVNKPGGLPLYWKNLKEQFGQEYKTDKDFKREFVGAIRKALSVYPDARVDKVKGGLRLFPSKPPVRKRAVAVALPKPEEKPVLSQATTMEAAAMNGPSIARSIAPARLTAYDLVSLKALEQVPKIAPGRDKYGLQALYVDFVNDKKNGEIPRHRDAAFLGWVRNYTQNKSV